MVDSWEVWEDFSGLALRPFGWGEVWIGYDPAKGTQNGDSAGCVVIARHPFPAASSALGVTSGGNGLPRRAEKPSASSLCGTA